MLSLKAITNKFNNYNKLHHNISSNKDNNQ